MDNKKKIMRHMLGPICFVLVMLTAFLGSVSRSHAISLEEYTLKAAFILNFAKFTHWPDNAFNSSHSTVHVCVIGDPSLENTFQVIQGKKIEKRTLNVTVMQQPTDDMHCDILFISRYATASVSTTIARFQKRPVLIIGETENFARSGGTITFREQKDKLRFEINRDAALQHGLKFSSKLLQLAIIADNNK